METLVTLKRGRRIWLSFLIVLWMGVFHYETLRYNYLSKWLQIEELPKLPLLFPPAGWIMFFKVTPQFGTVEIYQAKGNSAITVDPHDVFETQAVGYDNIRRNIMSGVLYRERAEKFCDYLKEKFPESTTFVVSYKGYPDLIEAPDKFVRKPQYRCQ